MQIITDPKQMQTIAEKLRLNRQRIGVVMTMGALHEGHLSLVSTARQHAGTIIMTIFVNPKQFGPAEDLHRYPRPFEQDVALASSAGVDYLFAPAASDMYPEGFATSVVCGPLADVLEGATRPGHFDGMITVVMKLLHITKPHKAVFGEKDAQQLAIIRRMVQDFNLDTEIIEAPVVREPDGLAVSSRNIYLSSHEREMASVICRAMQHAARLIGEGERNCETLGKAVTEMINHTPECRCDYACFVDPALFAPLQVVEPGEACRLVVAVFCGSTRLIDTMRMPT